MATEYDDIVEDPVATEEPTEEGPTEVNLGEEGSIDEYLNPETASFYEDLRGYVTDRIESPSIPDAGEIPVIDMEVEDEELLPDIGMDELDTITATVVSEDNLEIPKPPRELASTYQAYVSEDTPE